MSAASVLLCCSAAPPFLPPKCSPTTGRSSSGHSDKQATGGSMQSRKRWLLRVVCLGCAFGLVLLAVPTQAQQFAYVTNPLSDSVSVIDTATNTVIATVRGIARPIGVAVTPNGSRVYVTDTLNYVG